MPSAAEECHEPSRKCQGISHCLESGHPGYNILAMQPLFDTVFIKSIHRPQWLI